MLSIFNTIVYLRIGYISRIKTTSPIESQPLIHTILERISDGFVAFDKDFNYTYVNEAGAAFLGCEVQDLIGNNYWDLYPEAKGTPFANAYLQAMETQKPIYLEEYYEFWGKWFTNRIYPSPEGLSIFFSDVTERKKTEFALLRALEEKNTLFKELHHRIKNNLQMVASIMYLKTDGLKDPATKEFAKDINARIIAVASIHEHLLALEEVDQLPIRKYIIRLVDELIKMSAPENESKISFVESVSDFKFEIDDTLSIGMIIHEAVSNSLQHAFQDTNEGTITISLTKQEDRYHLTIGDNGLGYHESSLDSSSTGNNLIHNFVKQLHGTIEVISNGGTTVHITFPPKEGK